MWLILPSTESVSVAVPLGLSAASNLPCQSLPDQSIGLQLWSNGKRISRVQWQRALKTGRFRRLLGFLTLSDSTRDRIAGEWASSLPAFPASHILSQASARARTMNGGSGQTSTESSANSGQNSRSCSLKMSLGSFGTPVAILEPKSRNWKTPQMMLLEEWEPFSGIWPNAGLMHDGCVYALPVLESHIDGCESSSSALDGRRPGVDEHSTQGANLNREAGQWSTPNTPNGGRVSSYEDTANRGTTDRGKRQVGLEMETQYWATPMAATEGSSGGLKTGDGRDKSDLVVQARTWSTPRLEDRESAGNHPGAQDSLTGQTRLWMTPKVSPGAFSTRGDGLVLNLQGEATHWQTPQSRDWKSAEILPETAAKHLGSRPLNEQALNWPTPDANEMNSGVASISHRSTSLDQGWGRLALSMTSENFTDEALAELGNAIRPNSETPSPGPSCWCGSPGCAQPSHKRKLNPLFAAAMMHWPIWWLTKEPLPYARSGMALFLTKRRAHLSRLLGAS